MARYRGPKTKISRKFGEPLFGEDRSLEKKKLPTGATWKYKKKSQKIRICNSATGEAES